MSLREIFYGNLAKLVKATVWKAVYSRSNRGFTTYILQIIYTLFNVDSKKVGFLGVNVKQFIDKR